MPIPGAQRSPRCMKNGMFKSKGTMIARFRVIPDAKKSNKVK
jgi:hypothetical protein